MREKRTQETDGPVVYFIQPEQGGPIKIGYCTRRSAVPQRLAGLQTGHPYRLVVRRIEDAPCGQWEERKLHEKFAAYRLNGEWFLDVPELAMVTGSLLPDVADEARLLKPLLEKAYAAGREQGRQEKELETRMLLKEFFEGAVPWLFGEEQELHESLEASYAEIALDAIVSAHEARQIRIKHTDWMRRAAARKIGLGRSEVPSAVVADAIDSDLQGDREREIA